jgi:thioredoxin reductase
MVKINTENAQQEYDIAVIGGGPGGLAALLKANELGITKSIIIERESYPGGILPQCIHGGFGLKMFKKELTGPEYNQIFLDKVKDKGLSMLLGTMALKIDDMDGFKYITVSNKTRGFFQIKARAVILALGCRERTRGQILIPGSRPSGVFTAGLVQRMVNIEGYLPGNDVVILGSGDIGLIMARRLFLEGCNVKGVFELMPFSTGLSRNIVQCLDDYGIPLFYSHTVTKIYGSKRLEAVEISQVDRNLKPIAHTSKKIDCDTLLLSVGLIPENELSKTCGIEIDKYSGGPVVDENLETSVSGIFSCGNSLFVNDIVDDVTEAGYIAAKSAANYLYSKPREKNYINVNLGENIAYVVPQKISAQMDTALRIRVRNPLKNAVITISPISFQKKYKIIIPGEMIFLNISKEQLKSLNACDDLVVNAYRIDQKIVKAT